jgi:hypothetical protein
VEGQPPPDSQQPQNDWWHTRSAWTRHSVYWAIALVLIALVSIDQTTAPASAFRLCAIMPHVGQRGHYRFEKTEAWWPIRGSRPGLHGIYPDAEVDDFFAIEPGGMMHVMACSVD